MKKKSIKKNFNATDANPEYTSLREGHTVRVSHDTRGKEQKMGWIETSPREGQIVKIWGPIEDKPSPKGPGKK